MELSGILRAVERGEYPTLKKYVRRAPIEHLSTMEEHLGARMYVGDNQECRCKRIIRQFATVSGKDMVTPESDDAKKT